MGAEIILWINGRKGMIEDSHCIMASQTYGCVVGANITEGKNTGFAGFDCLHAKGTPEESRLFPRTKKTGDNCVHATIDLGKLRWKDNVRYFSHIIIGPIEKPSIWSI
jgi:hypothetical protein